MNYRDQWFDGEPELPRSLQPGGYLAPDTRPEPPWQSPEEDEDYTSATAFALLGVVLGNTLGFDLKPLLRQARAIKTVEDNTRDDEI